MDEPVQATGPLEGEPGLPGSPLQRLGIRPAGDGDGDLHDAPRYG
jgi:hypothetical protein